MAITAKMQCNTVSSYGGGVWLPLCAAYGVVESWPPPSDDLSAQGSIYGHGEGECQNCDVHAEQTDGKRMVFQRGKGSESVKLSAVASGDPDDPNTKWSAATPHGVLEMTINNPQAWEFFDPGAEYMVEVRRHVPSRGNRAQYATGNNDGDMA